MKNNKANLIASLVLHDQDRLVDAMARLQRTAKGIVMLVGSDGVLKRVITDGDLRRLLLEGRHLTDPLSDLPPAMPKVAPAGASDAEALATLDQHAIDQLPLVDETGRPVGLLLRRELSPRIFLSPPHIGEEELSYVAEAFATNWVAPLGPNVDAFEREMAAELGAAGAAAMSSGTAAIHVALRLLDVKAGDVVFCSSLTFVASANPILYQNATPVFIDCEPGSWCMSPRALQRALAQAAVDNRLPKAVIVVHLYGQSADMDPILRLCAQYGVQVIEDAAESLGATYRGRPSGTLGRVGIYSFNGNKIITTSGGGMLVSNEPDLLERARYLSTQARQPAAHYEHTEVGYNYRMSNVLAGIGRGQLAVLEQRVLSRRAIFARYVELLADVEEVEWMPEPGYGRANRWLTACTLKGDLRPGPIIEALARQEIEARPVWKPMHRQALFAGAGYFMHGDNFDCSGDLFDRGLCLPSGSNMTDGQIERVANALRTAIRKGR
ncbi:MAG TPA: DegT/DnrJ/EryC1/StrS family aminotransferase [Sphingomicrobium sp.]|nr:DegT/DnrJ/EryC1/StrS family aminotransferase [Sphingomicrobium sp.]